MKKLIYLLRTISLILLLFTGCAEFFVDSEPVNRNTAVNSEIMPKSISIEQISMNKYLVSWVAPSANVTGYEVWRKIENQGYQLLIKLPYNITYYVDSTSKPSITHYYKIRSYKDTTFSQFTSEVSTLKWSKVPAPSNLFAAANGINQVRLTWWDNTDDELFFILAWKPQSSSKYKDSIIVNANQEVAIISNLTFNENYIFRIRAVSVNGSSLWSNEVSAKPVSWNSTPPTPVLAVKYDTLSNSNKLTWTNVGQTINYRVEKKYEGSHYNVIYDGSLLEFDDKIIIKNKKIYYRITAYSTSEKVYSDYSTEIEILVK